MNNSNFGYDCRNNPDNCKFIPIFDELKEINYIQRYYNIFDSKISQFVTADLIKNSIEEKYNDNLIKLDKEDKFYAIKLDALNNKRLTDLEAAKYFEQKIKKRKSLIDFDEKYSSSIKSIAIKKIRKVNLTTRFLNGKMLMFSKFSIKIFIYDLIDVFMLPNQTIKKIYDKCNINKCYLYQNLTDTDSTSVFFVFICNLNCSVNERKSRHITFEAIIKSQIFERLDLLADFWEEFQCSK